MGFTALAVPKAAAADSKRKTPEEQNARPGWGIPTGKGLQLAPILTQGSRQFDHCNEVDVWANTRPNSPTRAGRTVSSPLARACMASRQRNSRKMLVWQLSMAGKRADFLNNFTIFGQVVTSGWVKG